MAGAWRAALAGGEAGRWWGGVGPRLGEPCGPGAYGGGGRACAGAARGVRRRHSSAATAAWRRSDTDDVWIEGEKGRGG